MWVDPEWRGCGLAVRLLTALEDRGGGGSAYREVYLDTNASLTEAIAMYETRRLPTDRAVQRQPRTRTTGSPGGSARDADLERLRARADPRDDVPRALDAVAVPALEDGWTVEPQSRWVNSTGGPTVSATYRSPQSAIATRTG